MSGEPKWCKVCSSLGSANGISRSIRIVSYPEIRSFGKSQKQGSFYICQSCGAIWEGYSVYHESHGNEVAYTGYGYRLVSTEEYIQYCRRWCEVASLDGAKVLGISIRDRFTAAWFDLPGGLDYSRGLPEDFWEIVKKGYKKSGLLGRIFRRKDHDQTTGKSNVPGDD